MNNTLEQPHQTAPPPGRFSREDQARIEIGHTDMGPAATWVLVVAFLAMLTAVPCLQTIREWRASRAERGGSRAMQVLEIGRIFPAAADAWREAGGGWWNRLKRANAVVLRDIHDYEEAVERTSFLRQRALPPAQWLLAVAGAGNEKAYIGRDGWLFYRPEIDLVTGPAFLESSLLARRAAGGNEWQPPPSPDPRTAILDFNKQLAARGIRLVLMPTPVKPMIHPEKFTSRAETWRGSMLNPSHQALLRELENAGVMVFDPTEILLAAKVEGSTGSAPPTPQFLATDTHWRPEAMDRVAGHLANFLRARLAISTPSSGYRRSPATVTAIGDIAQMLNLPADQNLFPPETVQIEQVRGAEGKDWSPDPASGVLLLGDSFSNIYSLEEMNWGAHAGFAEQLSYHLGRPVDAIRRNDSGAYATRQMLGAELSRGQDRLAGKKVVVWEFAAREFSEGDWKVIPLPALPATVPVGPKAPVDATPWQATVRGLVAAVSALPGKGVPYKDHIRALHLTGIEPEAGTVTEHEGVVYVWSMRDHEFTPESRLRAGDIVSLRIRRWADVADTLGRINRSELDDPDLLLQPAWWGDPLNR